ncbi:unnamed protein product [Rotaria sp. Silwood1]|nr:unnamed protein product [Rotaria sp. Silwood1]CAF4632197.1 unnamed protein product [Rotaria sp. Silwood1]CAF4768271.1 unnamed protein product [Rotaria sp. Silwood1]CAF4867747.1 unnamed protein product [Rotaria sp. Silwood1]CAF4902173.1 unnamed protein product [Rotaria sp. Silwood1]
MKVNRQTKNELKQQIITVTKQDDVIHTISNNNSNKNNYSYSNISNRTRNKLKQQILPTNEQDNDNHIINNNDSNNNNYSYSNDNDLTIRSKLKQQIISNNEEDDHSHTLNNNNCLNADNYLVSDYFSVNIPSLDEDNESNFNNRPINYKAITSLNASNIPNSSLKIKEMRGPNVQSAGNYSVTNDVTMIEIIEDFEDAEPHHVNLDKKCLDMMVLPTMNNTRSTMVESMNSNQIIKCREIKDSDIEHDIKNRLQYTNHSKINIDAEIMNTLNNTNDQLQIDVLRRSNRIKKLQLNKCQIINKYQSNSNAQNHTTYESKEKETLSAVSRHVSEMKHKIDWENCQVIWSDSTPHKLLIKESLIIKAYEPELNRTTHSIPLYIFPDGIQKRYLPKFRQ